MKKKLFAVLSLALLSAGAFANDQALEINITGKGPAVDGAAFTTVQQIIGNAIGNGIVDKFIVRGYAIEGGFSACIQASQRVKGFANVVRQLRTVQPNPISTAYSLTPATTCVEVVPLCTMDVSQCPDGSFVGRVPPSCEFAACPGQ